MGIQLLFELHDVCGSYYFIVFFPFEAFQGRTVYTVCMCDIFALANFSTVNLYCTS
jgi:hypothetical protein